MSGQSHTGGRDSSRDHAPDTGSALDGEPIWIVHGSTGEYSDRGEWVVCAYRSEGEAKAYVEFLGKKRQEVGPGRYEDGWDYDLEEQVEAAMRAFDPNFSEDYTGTRWFVRETIIRPSSAEQVAGASSRDEHNV